MPDKARNVLAAYTNRQIDLVRAAEGEAEAMRAMLEAVYEKIYAKIAKLAKPEAPVTFEIIRKIELMIQEDLKQFYEVDWPRELKELQKNILLKEIVWNDTAIENAVYGEDEDITPNKIPVPTGDN